MQIYEQNAASEEDKEDMRDLFHDCKFKEIKVEKRDHHHRKLLTQNIAPQQIVTYSQEDSNATLVKALVESISVN